MARAVSYALYSGRRLFKPGMVASLLLLICLLGSGFAHANPQPGDVFREYHIVGGGSNGSDEKWMDNHVFISHHTGERSTKGDRHFENIDLNHVIKAEFVASYWGGHVGSENKRVVFNDFPGINLPSIKNTPSMPECFFSQQCHAACEIPLDYLRQGRNAFRLEVDNQICYSFNWGWFWTNQVILRIYYDPLAVDHPMGTIVRPDSGAVLSDHPEIGCRVTSGPVKRIEFVGKYYDYSLEGSGDYYTWHWIHWMDNPDMHGHIGTAENEERSVIWENQWVPDQKWIRIAARIVDTNDMIYMTAPVKDIEIKRADRSVKMYPASFVPEAFATQTGSAECKIVIPDALNHATSAKLVVTTFSGGKPDRKVYLNGQPLREGGWGTWHRLAICEEPVPLALLNSGINTFEIRANMPGEHAFEVNWPGPAIFIEYKKNQ
ncbi:hypothetical protein GF406_06995 [candidate division KSB1 bacterium]|nr:hypothetical protein [candidate division KSB1 bacterium]